MTKKAQIQRLDLFRAAALQGYVSRVGIQQVTETGLKDANDVAWEMWELAKKDDEHFEPDEEGQTILGEKQDENSD